jgi:hypothetical protein
MYSEKSENIVKINYSEKLQKLGSGRGSKECCSNEMHKYDLKQVHS